MLDRFGPKAKRALPVICAAGMKQKDFVADFFNRMVEYLPKPLEAGNP